MRPPVVRRMSSSSHVRDMHRPTAVWTRHPHALARMRFHAPSRGMAPLRSRIGPVSKSRDLGRESGRASPAIPRGNYRRRRSECHTTTTMGGNYLRRKVFSDVYYYYDHIKLLADEIGWVSFEFSLSAAAITRTCPGYPQTVPGMPGFGLGVSIFQGWPLWRRTPVTLGPYPK